MTVQCFDGYFTYLQGFPHSNVNEKTKSDVNGSSKIVKKYLVTSILSSYCNVFYTCTLDFILRKCFCQNFCHMVNGSLPSKHKNTKPVSASFALWTNVVISWFSEAISLFSNLFSRSREDVVIWLSWDSISGLLWTLLLGDWSCMASSKADISISAGLPLLSLPWKDNFWS